ncbi:hypothetical protein [Roseateles sp. PN1]|uniref:hypothetical protein n=1 Tax=Roseateles sp. PN1 TaxID=3137372 RepID=UPI003138AE0D
MDRLVEHVVAWHNRHPLAKKITIYDVHTMGVVALPFLRSAHQSGGGGAGGEAIEPTMGDAPLGGLGESTLDAHANTTAQHLDALADQEEPPAHALARMGWRQRLAQVLGALAFWKHQGKRKAASSWPAFSEKFIPIAPRKIAAFAQSQGFLNPPGDASWPQRVVPIDEAMLAKHNGAWPFELYLLTAAIDAGNSRTRVLIGMGRKPQILGARCGSRRRLAFAAMVVLGLLAVVVALLMPHGKSGEHAVDAASAASAPASAAASSSSAATATAAASAAESAAAASAAAAALEAASAASAASTSASAAGANLSDTLGAAGDPASTPASANASASASASAASAAPGDKEEQPDIRPQLVKPLPKRTPFAAGSEGASKADGQKPGSDTQKSGPSPEKAKAGEGKGDVPAKSDKADKADKSDKAEKANKAGKATDEKTTQPLVEKLGPLDGLESGGTIHSAVKSKTGKSGEAVPVVALVGPVAPSKAEAEAMLARMLTFIKPLHPDGLNTSVVQTPQGWRAAVWPFDSRQEAQLINATLVARGMKTKAVDF